MKTFVGELKRRNVFRVGLTYLVVAWLVVQIVNNLVPILNAPDWVAKVVLIFLVAGFPVSLVLAWAYELTPEGLKRETAVTGDLAPPRGFGRKWDFVIIAGLIIALGYFAWDRFGTASKQKAADHGPAGAVTLAVLPFEDLSPNKNQGYFADGMTEELLNTLSRVDGLQVTARTSSFSFRGKDQDVRAIGKALGVETVLEGSVRKAGQDVRVTAELVNATSGYQLWSNTYDRTLKDIFAIQDEISKSVATALSIKLGVGALGRVPGMTRNVDAYVEYLRARSVQPDTASPQGIQAAIAQYEHAIAIDPDFALAWLRLSDLYNYAAGGNLSVTIEHAADKSKRDFERARALIPDSPEVLYTAAQQAVANGRWIEADELYGRALAAAGHDPDRPRIETGYSNFLGKVGRVKEGMAYLDQARAADPLDIDIATQFVWAFTASGDIPSALAEADRAMTLDGDQLVLRIIAVAAACTTGDRSEIEKRLKLRLAIKPGNPFIDVVDSTMGKLLDDPKMALAELRRIALDPRGQVPVLQGDIIPFWAGCLGDPEFALKEARGWPLSIGERWFPDFREARRLPGFKELLRDVGLVEYWRKTGHWGDYCHPVGDDDLECS
jgi:TolB-like protein